MQKHNKKKIALGALVLGLMTLGAGVTHAAINSATANTNSTTIATNHINPMNDLVSALATKFNLDPVQVQAVFDEQHTKMEVAHQAQEKSQLQQAVTDGKLTQEQMDKIIAKKAELDATRVSFTGKTETQMHALMKTNMDSLKQWAKDNNIPMQYMFGFGGDHHRGGKFN